MDASFDSLFNDSMNASWDSIRIDLPMAFTASPPSRGQVDTQVDTQRGGDAHPPQPQQAGLSSFVTLAAPPSPSVPR